MFALGELVGLVGWFAPTLVGRSVGLLVGWFVSTLVGPVGCFFRLVGTIGELVSLVR